MARVFPFANFFGITLDPDLYQSAVGITEITTGIMLSLFQGIDVSV